MAYKLESTNWKFTVPQEGEVDSAENKTKTLEEIDQALITPIYRSLLESGGQKVEGAPEALCYYDDYKGCYVTTLHEHPIPPHVPEADHATEADHAKDADDALRAQKLNPGRKINTHLFDGTKDITVGEDPAMEDVPGARRQFYGTVEPSAYKGFPTTLRDGDFYCKYYK